MIFDIIFFVFAALVVFVAYKLIFKKKSGGQVKKPAQVQNQQQQAAEVAQPNRNVRNVRNRFNPERNEPAAAEEEEEEKFDNSGNPMAKSKKELQKEAKKQAQRQQREAMQASIEAKKKKDDEKRAKEEEKEREKEEEEIRKQEELRVLEEEQRKKEEEEYAKWKEDMFIEEEGNEGLSFENEENMIQKFVEYIKLRKVVLLEDLSNDFRMATKEVIDRLEKLMGMGKLSGIIDDRGKFIYVTKEEFEAVKELIQRKGRISRSDLMLECNRLINLNPSEEDKEKIKQEQANFLKEIESDLKNLDDNTGEA